jgi:Rrf2 family nitric oxide-sensitive transcriptional repressor
MRITRYTEYSLRVLLYLGLHQDRLCLIAEIATAYRISESHLTKVVQSLGKQGFIETSRGRNGGLRLARAPETICLADVLRHTEDGLQSPDCAECPLIPACKLRGMLSRALRAFLQVFEEYTVADIITPGAPLRGLLIDHSSESMPHGTSC